jgi:hypothetical protein
MMETDGVYVDASRCYALFRRLSTRNQRKVSRAALREAANKLKKEAVKNLQGVVGHNVRKTTTYRRANGKSERRSLAKGVRVSAKNAETAKVHIMGDYRLKWLELNTNVRTTKGFRGKGKKIPLRRSSNRGRAVKDTARLKWFDKAVKAKEHEAARDIEEALIKHIKKQAKRDGITSN